MEFIDESVERAVNKARNAAKIALVQEKQADSARGRAISLVQSNKHAFLPEERFKNVDGLGYDKFRGFSVGNLIDGYGEYTWANGETYFGEWTDSKFHGIGQYIFYDGNIYEGTFVDGSRNGAGVFTFENGLLYKGNHINEAFNGSGVMIWPTGDRYEGEWRADNQNGYGIMVWTDGDRYEGEWKNGKRTGKGVFTYADGREYNGDFVDSVFQGRGMFTWQNGDRYVGDYKNGERTGKGIYTWGEGEWKGESYEGDFINSVRQGKGVYRYSNGNVYEGEFYGSEQSGFGTLTWANGDKYEGQWKDGVCHGKGVLSWIDGDKYDGEWKNGKRTGKGVFYYRDGTKFVGTFENGEEKEGERFDKDGKRIESKENGSNPPKNTTPKNNVNRNDDEKVQFAPESTNGGITFADVAGLEDVKEQIIFNVLEPMRNPELAELYGIKPGGKILLYGPPGTGKTLVARAIAGEVDAAFYSVSCQDLISKWLGESSERINNLFEEAQKNERAIIFFDEFDSVASKRESGADSAGSEISRFVATFLTKVDGFKPIDNKMLLLIAATNRPWALDSAMTRGGRFDTQIYVGVPDQAAREFLVEKALGKLPLAPDVDLKEIAQRLEGYGGGDITAICDKIKLEAYKKSVRTGKKQSITVEDCEAVMATVKNNITKAELEKFEAYKNGYTVK